MKIITIIEDERARSVYVRADGDVTVFDRDRKFRFRCDIAGAETTWQIMARITPHVVAAEARAIGIEALADRCRTGWLPVAEEIDADVQQRTMLRSGFGVDLMRYPDDPEFAEYSRATLLMGRDQAGHALVTGEILWIDAAQRWAVCEDGFCGRLRTSIDQGRHDTMGAQSDGE
jgi:hypothetical protein